MSSARRRVRLVAGLLTATGLVLASGLTAGASQDSESGQDSAQGTTAEPLGFEDARCPTAEEEAVIFDQIDVGEAPAGGGGSIGSDYVYRGPTCVLVERDLEAPQLSENFIPFKVTLFDPETGEPEPAAYEVFASVRTETFQDEELYPFAYPFRDDPSLEPGVYRGIVIVPFTGRWTVAVSAFDRVDFDQSGVPTPLGRATIEIDVIAPTLESAVDIGRVSDPSGADGFEVITLGLHSLLGLGWFAFAGTAALIATTPRRRWFSENTNDAFDRNVDRVVQGVIWTTVFIWVTGIINLNRASAYSPPLSPDQASDLFALPYARPYTIALYVKMATYAVMTLLAVPLVRAARRQAAEWIDLPPADEAGEDGAAVDGRTQPRLGLLSRASIGSLFVGGAIIFVCVTALKYLHILSETVRGLL